MNRGRSARSRRAPVDPALGHPVLIRCGSIALLVLLLAACDVTETKMPEREMRQGEMREGGGTPEKEMGANRAMASDPVLTDFATLVPPRYPNNWLIAPATFGPAAPDETAPTLDVPAERLAEIWIEIIKEQPRTRVLGVSTDGLQIEAEQDSAVFGFTDKISVRILALDTARSTLIAYSRSEVGYWDLGVNRTRLREWLATLQARAGSL
jgi:hypothetical protein